MKISVVTPSFNQAEFIDSTMRSIHDQSYPELEHIVIDGGSTDGSVEIIEKYADRLAYWTSERDDGQTDALIKGFDRATGDIFCWLNSDDLFETNSLHEVADFFRQNPNVHFVFGDSTWIDRNGQPFKPKREHGWNRFVWMYDHNFIPQPSAFWRADLYRAVGGLDRQFNLAMDADLWIRFAQSTQPQHVKRLWSRMRFYPEQKNTRMRAASAAESAAIRARYLAPSRGSKIKTLGARAVRAGLKAASGAYSLSELRRHAGTLLGRGTWEQQEAKRTASDLTD